MRPSLAPVEPAESDAKYAVPARCPRCGRKHITVSRLRHVSDNFFLQLAHCPPRLLKRGPISDVAPANCGRPGTAGT